MTGETRPVWDCNAMTHPSAPAGQRQKPAERRTEKERRVEHQRRMDQRRADYDRPEYERRVTSARRAFEDERRSGTQRRQLPRSRPSPAYPASRQPTVARDAGRPSALRVEPGVAGRSRTQLAPPQVPVPAAAVAGRGWRGFVRRYGWRAYALPMLMAVTVLALFTTDSPRPVRPAVSGSVTAGLKGSQLAGSPPDGSGSRAPSAARTPSSTGSGSTTTPAEPSSRPASNTPMFALPPGPAYAARGSGTFSIVPGQSAPIGQGVLRRFTIEVEGGISGVDPNQFGNSVVASLSDPRSWRASGQVSLQRVDSGPVDFRVSLASSMTVRDLCGYSLPVETSCYDGGQSRVVLNVARWVRGARLYAGELATYRIYAVNHEVGHALGHNHSHVCLGGGLAPVMMQQTIGGKTADGQTCRPNPWPYPTGARDAPGTEDGGQVTDDQFFRRNA